MKTYRVPIEFEAEDDDAARRFADTMAAILPTVPDSRIIPVAVVSDLSKRHVSWYSLPDAE